MVRTVQQVLADQAADADRERNGAGTDVAPYDPGGGDGFGVREKPAGLIRGTGFRFVDGKYFRTGSREEIAGDMQLVAVGMITAWQKWVDQELADIRVTPDGGYHPSREALPDDDPALWPIGKDGKPSDPWADARYVSNSNRSAGASAGGAARHLCQREHAHQARTQAAPAVSCC